MKINFQDLFWQGGGNDAFHFSLSSASQSEDQALATPAGEFRAGTIQSGAASGMDTALDLSTVTLLHKYGIFEHYEPLDLDGDDDHAGHSHEGHRDGDVDFSIRGEGTALTNVSVPAELLVDGTVDNDDIDAYAFELVEGQTYLFSAFGSGENPLEDTVVYVFDEGGNLIALDDDGGAGRMSLLTYTAAYTGTHIIGVSAFPGLGLTGDYTLDAVESPGVDVVSDLPDGVADFEIGDTVYGFIDSADPGPYGAAFGEVDTYEFEVEAGKYYTFEIAGGADSTSDPFALLPGELDTVVVVYGADGSVITSNDDISFPGDVSSRVGFFAQEDGVYSIDVFSYAPWTGGFSITSQEVDIADLDPLDSLNWFNADNIEPNEDNIVYVFFGDSDVNFGQTGDDGEAMVTIDWNDYEVDQVMLALEEYEKILGFEYRITEDADEATFKLLKTESEQYGAYFFPQDPAFGEDNQGVGVFNVNSGAWTFDEQQSLAQGGFSFAVILHEFGHAHGVAHPHDNGGGSDILLGVTASTGSLGLYDLNQGVYTVMSYNDAWEAHPDGPSPFTVEGIDNGWSGTLGAFDIAILQERYGIINDHATGDDDYKLDDIQARGTYYETIWDTGGTDRISYSGRKNARIDLLAATIDYTPTGGGVVSFVNDPDNPGLFGGFTIAQGVEIENASGGSGDDTLIGNDLDNVLEGNGGDDIMLGRAGADTFDGGRGIDTVSYIDAEEGIRLSLATGRGYSGAADGDRFIFVENIVGTEYDDRIAGDDGDNNISGLGGDDTLLTAGGNDTADGGEGDDRIITGDGDDVALGGDGNDTVNGGNGADLLEGGAGDDVLRGGNDADTLLGGDGNDTISAGNGADDLDGGAGDDWLRGGNDSDDIIGGEGDDTVVGANGDDTVDAGAGNDRVVLGNGADEATGGDGDDLLNGGNESDTLSGDAGDDKVAGGNDDDTVLGGAGNDTVRGDDGNDYIDGGTGGNLLVGGNGDDIFAIDSTPAEDGDITYNIVRDFGNGEDTVSLFNSAPEDATFLQIGAHTALILDGSVVATFLGANAADVEAATEFGL